MTVCCPGPHATITGDAKTCAPDNSVKSVAVGASSFSRIVTLLSKSRYDRSYNRSAINKPPKTLKSVSRRTQGYSADEDARLLAKKGKQNGLDSRPAHIREVAETSLKRLKTDRI